MLFITSAAITPGTQPIKVKIKTIRNDPQPLSTTASGGKIMQSKTRQKDIRISVLWINNTAKLQFHIVF